MEGNKLAGIFSAVLGLLFIIFPMFSAGLVSVIVGLSLLFFGITAIFTGWSMRNGYSNISSALTMLIGLIIVILGFIFIFYIDALSFLVGLQFYILGFIMIVFGIGGLFSRMGRVSAFSAILVLIMGIIAIVLAACAISQPIYIAIIIGIVLIIEGIALILAD